MGIWNVITTGRYQARASRRPLSAGPRLGMPVVILVMLMSGGIVHAAQEPPQGVDSRAAYEMVLKDLDNTFVVDVRTRAEYEFVGHPDLPNGAPNIPIRFYPGWKANERFVDDVAARFNKDQILITMCRSGVRAKKAAQLLREAGFKKVYYMTDSFEGAKDAKGHRTVNGWKVNGLPYTYDLDARLVYH